VGTVILPRVNLQNHTVVVMVVHLVVIHQNALVAGRMIALAQEVGPTVLHLVGISATVKIKSQRFGLCKKAL